MKVSVWNLLPVLFFISSCSENEEPQSIEETFWVYSYPINSMPGFIPVFSNFAISHEEEFNFDRSTWEFIPQEIEGFTFKPTYLQRLLVLKKEASNTGKVERKLIKVLEEEKDYYDLIEGTWKVIKYEGSDLPNKNFPIGQSVFILPGILRIAGSSDGCNNLTLEIQKVGPHKIFSFGSKIMTQRACLPDWHNTLPFPGLNNNFKREGNTLTFSSETEGEVAVWEKLN
jgi:hypothetical protein